MSTNITDIFNGVHSSLAIKAPCATATTGHIELSGLQIIGGVQTIDRMRVLVKDQTDARENGIYNASSGLWSRAADFDGNRDVTGGTLVMDVTNGGVYRASVPTSPVVIGTTEISFVLFHGGVSAEFSDSDYIDSTQLAFIRAFDTASQDASVVTAGLQAMHDAMMAFVSADASGDRVAVGCYSGAYACNNELFSETFAQNLWDLSVAYTRAKFVFKSEGLASFRVADDWPGHAAVRTSGFYAQNNIVDPVPMCLFRWEQKSRLGLSPYIQRIRFIGREDIENDPILFKARDVNRMILTDYGAADCGATGIWLENVNNSDMNGGGEISKCGWQPSMFGGNGLIPEGTTFSTVAGAGTTTVTASSSIFTAAHVGQVLLIEDAGVSGDHFYGIITAQGGTTATLNRQCTSNVSGVSGTFNILRGSVSADSAALTLDADISVDLVGRYVMVHKAGSKIHTEQELLVTRVIAHSGTSVTLATEARNTVSNTPIVLAPSKFIGKSDDMVDSGGTRLPGHNNDFQIYGERLEFSFDNIRGTAVGSVYQNCLETALEGSKIHGTSKSFNNAGNGFAALFDNCKNMWTPNLLVSHHGFDPSLAKLIVTGARTQIEFVPVSIGTNFESEASAFLYLDPEDSGNADCKISWRNFNNHATFPHTDQEYFRYGANGSISQITAVGPSAQRGVSGPSGEPPTRVDSLFIGGDPMDLAAQTSFTPTVQFSTNGDFTPANSTLLGRYSIVGDMAFFSMSCVFDTNAYTTASGTFQIVLPFTSIANGVTNALLLGRCSNIVLNAADRDIVATLGSGTDTVVLSGIRSSGAFVPMTIAHFPASTTDFRVEVSGSVRVA